MGNKLYVSSPLDHTVQVFDAKTTRMAQPPIATGRNPYALASDGSSLWVTNVADDSLTRIPVG